MSIIEEKLLDDLRELIGGDTDALRELIETFLEEGREMVLEMNQSLEGQNLDVLRRCAHSMKSSSQDFGALELSEMNAALESQCKNDWPPSASEQVSAIAIKFDAVSDALSKYISMN